ncbi:MAG: hypothetical protein R2716_05900 [Microthrixaceae bacterium]
MLDEAHEAEDILAVAFEPSARRRPRAQPERNMRGGGRLRGPQIRAAQVRRCARPPARRARRRLLPGRVPELGRRSPRSSSAADAVADASSAPATRECERLGGSGAAEADRARSEAARRNAEQLSGASSRTAPGGRHLEDAIWIEERGSDDQASPDRRRVRLAERAWGGSAAVLTSATVSCPMLGCPGSATERSSNDVGSPSTIGRRRCSSVPPLLSSHPPRDYTPNNPAWLTRPGRRHPGSSIAAEGRTLFLCTSYRNAREPRELAPATLDWPVLFQVSCLPKLSSSRDPDTVAVGTMGLWQGWTLATR